VRTSTPVRYEQTVRERAWGQRGGCGKCVPVYGYAVEQTVRSSWKRFDISTNHGQISIDTDISLYSFTSFVHCKSLP